MTPRIRRARVDEAERLTLLARRSKAHWGYDAEFMRRVADDIVIPATAIEAGEVHVLEDDAGAVLGVHRLRRGDPAVLEDLWLEPGAIGTGNGRRLWQHAVALARASGARAVELDADPNAVGFYERMGAVRIGETPSGVIEGRMLPRMRLELKA